MRILLRANSRADAGCQIPLRGCVYELGDLRASLRP